MPVDRGAIDAQLREIGEGERWWEQREFRDLPHVLRVDERIQALAHGKLLGIRRPRMTPAPRWLFVVTNQRLICLRQHRFAREQVDIMPGSVTRLRQGGGLLSTQIAIATPRRRYRIRIPKVDTARFWAALEPFAPTEESRPRIHPDLEPVSWIPGVATVAALPGVSGLVSKVSLLSPQPLASPDHVARLESNMERLQADVEHLREQVEFLEELLGRRAEAAGPPVSAGD